MLSELEFREAARLNMAEVLQAAAVGEGLLDATLFRYRDT